MVARNFRSANASIFNTRRPSTNPCTSKFAAFASNPSTCTITRTASPCATSRSPRSGSIILKCVRATLSKFAPGINARKNKVPNRFSLFISNPDTANAITPKIKIERAISPTGKSARTSKPATRDDTSVCNNFRNSSESNPLPLPCPNSTADNKSSRNFGSANSTNLAT